MPHIDLPTRDEIEAIASERNDACVSIYVSTTPVTQAAQIDRIELKNLGREAIRQLEAADIEKRRLWPIEAALDEVIADDGFWAFQAHSLALFLTPERMRAFRLPNRLESRVEVSDRFHLKPLLRAVTFPQNAWVLAIGMGAVRLVEVTADLAPSEVKVPGLPKDMAAALGRRGHGERTGVGESGEATSEHALLVRYARTVDRALRPVLAGRDIPLIVAAAEPLASVYRAVSTYGPTAAEVIPGSADQKSDAALADAARGVLDRIYAAELEGLAGLYAERVGQGRATADVAQAARAATMGAIDTLVVDMDESLPGFVDADGGVTFSAENDAKSYGVVDEITRRALLTGARVVSGRAGDIPGGGALAAILRYAV